MTQPETTPQNAYQKDGAQYLQKIIQLFGGYKKRSFAFLNLAPGQHVLDVGCGTGDDAMAMAGFLGPDAKIIGMDHNEAMLQPARERAHAAGLPVEFVQGDAVRLPFPDDTFDRVRADRVFQHLENMDDALAEMIRVAKRGAWISVLDVDWASLLIDSSDPVLTRNILQYQFHFQVNGSAGSQLYGVFKRSPLTSVEAYAETVCVTEWPIANMIWGLDVFVEQAAESGIITKAEALSWIADLEARHRDGQFFSSITGFVVRGQKV